MTTHIQLINTLSGQAFDYYIEHSTNMQLYYRVSVLMVVLAEIENVSDQNISFNIPQVVAA